MTEDEKVKLRDILKESGLDEIIGEGIEGLQIELLREFALNEYVTSALEGKGPVGINLLVDNPEFRLDKTGMSERFSAEWDKIMERFPKALAAALQGKGFFETYDYYEHKLDIGGSTEIQFMQLDSKFTIAYGERIFETPQDLNANVHNHQLMQDTSRQILQDSFERAKEIVEDKESAAEFIVEMGAARQSGSCGYWIRYAIERCIGGAVSRILFNKSYKQVVRDRALKLKGRIRAHDALYRFFRGEERYIDSYIQEKHPGGNSEEQIKRIQDYAKDLSHINSRIREETLKELQQVVLYAPANIFARQVPRASSVKQ